jgi:glycosyltransferase involved in cell wall biosynthesis
VYSTLVARLRTSLGRPKQVYRNIVNQRVRPLVSTYYLRLSGEFSPELYLKLYPDVAAAGVDPYMHYVRYGRAEGRVGKLPDFRIPNGLEPARANRETVLVVCHDGSRTGAPVLAYNLVQGLLEKYHVVALFLGPGPVLEACRAAGAVVIGPIPIRASAALAETIIGGIASAVALKFAVINSIEARYLTVALTRRDVATVTLVHEFAANTRPEDAFREAALWSGQLVFSSGLTRDNAISEYPELGGRDYPIIPQGRCVLPQTDTAPERTSEEAQRIDRVVRPASFPRHGIVVLGAGYIHFRKGVDLFIDCAARVLRHQPDLPIRFVWVGKGYEPETDISYSVYLADQIRRAGLEGHVHFLDEVADLDRVYALANVLLLSSRLDPLPNVAIDALARGLPVICFDKTTGIAEILRDHGLAPSCVAAYLDSEDAAGKILALAQSAERRAEIAAQGARIAATFDMPRYVAAVEELAVRDLERARQERRDIETISESNLPRLDFYRPPHASHQTRNDALLAYVRSWATGVGRRKLFPGFHPGIYLEQHGVARPGTDPLADYLRAGQPRGPWNFDMIRPGDKSRALPAGIRVGLHIHAYYPDLFPQILERLERNQARPDLLISVTETSAARAVETQLRAYRTGAVTLRIVPNRGRDIGSFLTEFGDTLRHRYDLIGHVHTKKTADLKDPSIGQRWFAFLLENLVGGTARMADIILGRMADDSRIGMAFPDDPNVIGWGKNLPFVERYFSPLGITSKHRELAFPVGTMFWARPSALSKLFDLGLSWEEYPDEPLPYDGSLVHGLERVFGLLPMSCGSTVAVTNVSGSTR